MIVDEPIPGDPVGDGQGGKWSPDTAVLRSDGDAVPNPRSRGHMVVDKVNTVWSQNEWGSKGPLALWWGCKGPTAP